MSGRAQAVVCPHKTAVCTRCVSSAVNSRHVARALPTEEGWLTVQEAGWRANGRGQAASAAASKRGGKPTYDELKHRLRESERRNAELAAENAKLKDEMKQQMAGEEATATAEEVTPKMRASRREPETAA